MSSYRFRTGGRQRKFVSLIGVVHSEIDRAFADWQAETGGTKSDLADKLGVHKSVLTRRLSGTANMTFKAVADLAWALDREVVFRMGTREELTGHSSNVDSAIERLDRERLSNRETLQRQRPRTEWVDA